MLNSSLSNSKSTSLMSEYSSLLGDAILRDRTRTAEQSAQIESEIASRIKSEFIANMSHELRTPLNTVIGFSKILAEHGQRKLADDEIIEYAKLIGDGAAHLLTVINDVLDISKIQSGRYSIEARDLNITDIITDVIASQQAQLKNAGIKLTRDIPDDLPQLHGDAEKLQQVFYNLLSNAIKFTQNGGEINIAARYDASRGMTITLKDSGIGMTPEEVRLAMAPFGQVDGGRSRWREGTGLGLPISKALIELHGGSLEIVSHKDQGTQINIILPAGSQISLGQARDALLEQGSIR